MPTPPTHSNGLPPTEPDGLPPTEPDELLTPDDVRRVARLTRIAMTDREVETLRAQLARVLDHFQSLRQIDTTDVEPTGHATDTSTVMRNDEPRPSLPREAVLKNAPEVDDPFIRVKPVLGDDPRHAS
jgi:aspartyl-tRNA(Asn)/glutamyl-tRNA(Gln) amidotransferase subunit C